jgi:SAM-dependent methyltransferase
MSASKAPPHFCPICERAGAFQPFGSRPNARCPGCGSLERHRFAWVFLTRQSDLFAPVSHPAGRRFLHIAPEPCLSRRFRSLDRIGYTPADLKGGPGVEKIDITNIDYPPMTFDIIFCSHVLEHVEEDRKAISELHRVLSPTGWAILMVPINLKETYEDPKIQDPRQRELHFGQWDHVRSYGLDFADRLRECGIQMTCFRPESIVSDCEFASMSLLKRDWIFFCTK